MHVPLRSTSWNVAKLFWWCVVSKSNIIRKYPTWWDLGPVSLTVFLPAIQIRWKLCFGVIPLLAIRSQQIFAHDTTAELSCHVQNFVAIIVLESRWEWNKISPVFLMLLNCFGDVLSLRVTLFKSTLPDGTCNESINDRQHFRHHFGLDNMAPILQTIFCKFILMEIHVFGFQFHYNLFLRVQLTICKFR